MSLTLLPLAYKAVVLDIEGTVCPISFVKDELFPYFVSELPSILSEYKFPLESSTTQHGSELIYDILIQFPASVTQSQELLLDHIQKLVKNDVKDPVLKQLQGFIWEKGYTSGSITAPLFPDAIEAIYKWTSLLGGVYIYSSGSVKAQKLLFGNVCTYTSDGKVKSEDLNHCCIDYFDTVNIGSKVDVASYNKILQQIPVKEKKQVLFLSDNPLEVEAALKSGMSSYIVVKPGNYELNEDENKKYEIIRDFGSLF
ncbi:hypothetical protein CANARDRAFT_8692 [[Candida] arabinofermentans NRRL YB-2248]|uniref:Enolase-phosphatase E1 n=1 Tax=[Candida] arabinofermentans NRRL YB-2248 TaxID=983967 RepID=A0A1E4SXW3_9ASCO|nr:hypothetical protein CANARDRAFT_8692 [[Candida] arabinofermentans NRRL YB-2248]